MTIIRIGLDTAKHVFQVHGVDKAEQPVLRRQVRRSELEKFVAKLAPARIGLEACGASHHWTRVLGALGHAVVLMPPLYITPAIHHGPMSSAARTPRSTRGPAAHGLVPWRRSARR